MSNTPSIQQDFDSIPIPTTTLGLLREARLSADLARAMLHLPRALSAPRGPNEPVLLLPGLAAGDGSMWMLGSFLRRLGWQARGWGLGLNRGNPAALLPRVVDVADRIAQQRGLPVRMVGWSLGGFLAREVARDRPDLVAQIITMGTPVVGGPKYTTVASLMRMRRRDIEAAAAECAARARLRIEAPITAIYSRRDGVVAWQACIDRDSPRVEHVEVASTHAGLGWDLRVWRIVADRLAGVQSVSSVVPHARTTRHRSRPRRGWPSATKRARARKRPACPSRPFA